MGGGAYVTHVGKIRFHDGASKLQNMMCCFKAFLEYSQCMLYAMCA